MIFKFWGDFLLFCNFLKANKWVINFKMCFKEKIYHFCKIQRLKKKKLLLLYIMLKLDQLCINSNKIISCGMVLTTNDGGSCIQVVQDSFQRELYSFGGHKA